MVPIEMVSIERVSIEMVGGNIAAATLGNVASYSAGGRYSTAA
jgi:hypothetical protein